MKVPKLTTRFLIIVFVIFIAMAGVFSVLLYFEISGTVHRLGRRYTVERVEAGSARIGDNLQREATLALKLADSPTIKRWMQNENDPALEELAFAELESFRRAFLDSSYFVVVDESLTYYNRQPNEPLAVSTLSRDTASDQWYFATIGTGEKVSFNLDFNVLIRQTKVWINCVVRSDDEIIGLAGTGLDISELIENFLTVENIPTNSMLVDASGEITAHSDVEIMKHNAQADSKEDAITVFDLAGDDEDRSKLEELLKKAEDGKTAVDLIRLEGRSGLTAAAPIPQIDWIMVESVDPSTFVEFADFSMFFLLLIISIVAVLLAIGVLMRRFVLKPLGIMTVSANRIASGNYDLRLPIERKDEIGTLASAFNEMTSKVKEYTTNLEQIVERRTAELEQTNNKLENVNRRLTDSIQYAAMIQESIIPSKSALNQRLSEVSFFLRQRDIVGGDFLFLRDTPPGYLIAVADCEGHGVSGALMTMMVDSFLKLIIPGVSEEDPAMILTELDRSIRSSMLTSEGESRLQVGMEIGLCACFPERKRLIFAGAGMPLYALDSKGTVQTIHDRNRAIGHRHRLEQQPFENHEFSTEEYAFFLVSDGFVDQSGGESGRAFGTKRLFETISDCSDAQLCEDKPGWENRFDRYKGSYETRDDVLALGFRV